MQINGTNSYVINDGMPKSLKPLSKTNRIASAHHKNKAQILK